MAPQYNLPSALSTPELSGSSRPSPALQRIQTPDEELPAFNLGEAALAGDKLPIPGCWAHRGASAAFPENTKASFVEACRMGADGLETGKLPQAKLIDLHITSDNVLLMFHDPELDRTTDGQGRIREQPWHGVLEHVRTKQSPVQPIPLLSQVLEIMLFPGNEHLKLNLDCKVQNDPDKLFKLMREGIMGVDKWEERLAPRLVLGLWHPKFLAPAAKHLPCLPRYNISMSLVDSRRFFWHSVHGMSIWDEALSTADGQVFLAECRAAGKKVCAWTVNTKEGMRDCIRWGLESCITDKPDLWQEVQAEFRADTGKEPGKWTYVQAPRTEFELSEIDREAREYREYLEDGAGGKYEEWEDVNVGLDLARA